MKSKKCFACGLYIRKSVHALVLAKGSAEVHRVCLECVNGGLRVVAKVTPETPGSSRDVSDLTEFTAKVVKQLKVYARAATVASGESAPTTLPAQFQDGRRDGFEAAIQTLQRLLEQES